MTAREFILKHCRPFVPFIQFIRNGTTKPMCKWPEDKLIKANMRYFKHIHGYSFDLKNPQTFNEKIQWYKFYYQRDDFAQIVDKVLFKDYITQRLSYEYVIPMYGAWDNIQSLEDEWDALPDKFVLKANLQGSGNNIKVIDSKAMINFDSIRDELKSWLEVKNTLMNSCDRKFYTSKPMILAEQFTQDEFGELRDYKFFCFSGKPLYFKVDYSRFQDHHANYYDDKMNFLDIKEDTCPPDPNTMIELPSSINQMFDLAAKLSNGFPFIRVDFYSVYGKVYVSEMTFNPAGGFHSFEPKSFDKQLGDLFVLPY